VLANTTERNRARSLLIVRGTMLALSSVMPRIKRTDPHRPGAIVPAQYEHRICYSLPTSEGGWPMPAIRVDCARPIPTYGEKGQILGYHTPTCPDSGRCCVASAHRAAAAAGRAVFGSAGRCGVCGAIFVYGALFLHTPTGQLVHMGHDCASKYECMFDKSAWELENGRMRQAAATAISRSKNERERAAFLDKHPGLDEALALGDESSGDRDRRILGDLAARLRAGRTLSEKQVVFAGTLAQRVRRPAPERPEEERAEAPVGKGISFEGEIISVKAHESYFGGRDVLQLKATIRVTLPGGAHWIAWGTLPASLVVDAGRDPRPLGEKYRGRRVRIKATLERPAPRDAEGCETEEEAQRVRVRNAERHFVIMKRPRGEYVDVPPPAHPPLVPDPEPELSEVLGYETEPDTLARRAMAIASKGELVAVAYSGLTEGWRIVALAGEYADAATEAIAPVQVGDLAETMSRLIRSMAGAAARHYATPSEVVGPVAPQGADAGQGLSSQAGL